jgi:hypothetical protein
MIIFLFFTRLLHVLNEAFSSTRRGVWLLIVISLLLGVTWVGSHSLICLYIHTKVRVTVILPPTIIRPVYLGVKPPSGAQDHIFVTVRQLLICCALWSDRTENTVSNISFIVAFVSVAAEGSCRVLFTGRYQAGDNLFSLHYSGSQACHIASSLRLLVSFSL